MERPSLQRLMAEVKQGLADVVVVYTVNRLTRSLADFAKIVEVLDGHGRPSCRSPSSSTPLAHGTTDADVLLSFRPVRARGQVPTRRLNVTRRNQTATGLRAY
jgi:hypothetical protein